MAEHGGGGAYCQIAAVVVAFGGRDARTYIWSDERTYGRTCSQTCSQTCRLACAGLSAPFMSAHRTHFPHQHLLGIAGLSRPDIEALLDMAEDAVALSRRADKKRSILSGRTQINLFFEASTRTQASFELAGKRLGADVMNMSVATSSVSKGETLIDTAVTLNAMRPDVIVVRHQHSGAVHLLARKVSCCVVNAGDGSHEHPTQCKYSLFLHPH